MKESNQKKYKKIRVTILLISFLIISFLCYFDLRGISYNFKLNKDKVHFVSETIIGKVFYKASRKIFYPKSIKARCVNYTTHYTYDVSLNAPCKKAGYKYSEKDSQALARASLVELIVIIIWASLMMLAYKNRFKLVNNFNKWWNEI